MNRIRQWTVQRPRWATVFAGGIVFAAILVLAYVAASHVAGAALVAAISLLAALFAVSSLRAYFAGKPLFQGQKQGTLEFDGAGQWALVDAAARRSLQLTHAWPAFAWVRLRFRAALAAGSKETMLELTVWKASVSSEAWRELRMLLARQAALPEWRVEKGGGR